MPTKTISHKHKTAQKALWQVIDTIPDEVLVFCPACKALDVVRFNGQNLIPTRKFTQQDNKVFHACGTETPCRLHRLGGHSQIAAASDTVCSRLTSRVSRRNRVRSLVQA
jgi:hypothetical protein